eukprot:4578505-Lingulodinium_polyedra.AAC.1
MAMAGVAKYVKKCTQLGGHWCRAREMADMFEVFWVETGIDNVFQKAWTVSEEAEMPQPPCKRAA